MLHRFFLAGDAADIVPPTGAASPRCKDAG
jgi:hypothetical protein